MGKSELEKLSFSPSQRHVPGILIPLWGVDGNGIAGYQYRPVSPRFNNKGKPIKYENPLGASVRLDVLPTCRKLLGNPDASIWFVEGVKKADSLASREACAVTLTGVWNFKGRNSLGGTTILTDFDYIALKDRECYICFDSDYRDNPSVSKAVARLGEHLSQKGARVMVVYLPLYGINDKKPAYPCTVCGADNWWRRNGGRWLCGRCHPEPQGEGIIQVGQIGGGVIPSPPGNNPVSPLSEVVKEVTGS
ncbi:DUF3854 domain-containing protein [Chloroflexota bacterium]